MQKGYKTKGFHNIQYIVAPQWHGANKKGTEIGAQRVAELFNKEGDSELIKLSIPEDANEDDKLMPHFNVIDDANRSICESVNAALSAGNKVDTIGGDHSVSWGSISGALTFNPEVGVIYIDAHGDCNIAERSLTHHIHGMHMAYLMGFGDSKYVSRYTHHLLPVKNIIYVGARSLDPYEVELFQNNDIAQLSSDLINSNRQDTLESISKFMSHFKQIHISLDIDVLAPSLAPGTGVPEVGGISEESLFEILDAIIKTDKVRSLDLVEYNPLFDIDYRTEKIIERLVKRLSRI